MFNTWKWGRTYYSSVSNLAQIINFIANKIPRNLFFFFFFPSLEHNPHGNKGQWRLLHDESIFHIEADRPRIAQPEEEKAWGDLINVYKYQMEGNKEEGAWLFSLVLIDKTRGNGQSLKPGKIPPEHKGKQSYCGGSQTLAQVTQRGCVVSVSGDTENLTRHCSEQLDLELPLLEPGDWTRWPQ